MRNKCYTRISKRCCSKQLTGWVRIPNKIKDDWIILWENLFSTPSFENKTQKCFNSMLHTSLLNYTTKEHDNRILNGSSLQFNSNLCHRDYYCSKRCGLYPPNTKHVRYLRRRITAMYWGTKPTTSEGGGGDFGKNIPQANLLGKNIPQLRKPDWNLFFYQKIFLQQHSLSKKYRAQTWSAWSEF